MKTKVLKSLLPVFAMLLGVGMTFSTEPEASLNRGFIQGPNGPIEVQVDCKSETSESCYFMTQQVFKDENLSEPLTKSLP